MSDYLWLDSILILVLVFLIVLSILVMRNRLLKLWHTVSRLEVSFHSTFEQCIATFIKYEGALEPYDPGHFLSRLKSAEDKHLRNLDLDEKQSLHRAVQTLIVAVDESDVSVYTTLRDSFDALQHARLKYNSAVLHYNHLIRAFPIRFLANRIGLSPKDYFG
ncbi:MAG: LemA family protein [Bacillota bacterium]